MNRKQSEVEGRLDDMLSRIAMETQEIKELEQQLTDGQILANESLQRDLEGIISGLQEHLRELREQASAAQQQLHSLQAENQSLQRLLQDRQRHCRQLEDDLRTHKQDMSVQQEELHVLQQLREELTQQITLGQDENLSLQQEVQRLQIHLDQTRTHLDQITASMVDQIGPEELDEDKYSPVCPEDMLSRSVEQLYRAIQQTRTTREQLQQDQDQSQDQIARLQDHITQLEAKLVQDQVYINQMEAQMEFQVVHRVNQDRGQDQDQDQEQEQEPEPDWRLREELQRSQSRNRSRLLQDVQQERDELLQQLHSQTAGHQRSFDRLNRKLRQLSRSMCDSDQLTAEQLESTCEQLRALNSLVELLHQQEDSSFHPPGQTAKGAQRHTHRLSQKLDQTRTRTRTRDGGWWGFIPPGHSDHSLGSLGPQDSGLGSPEKGRQGKAPPGGGGGSWVDTGTAGGAVLHRDTGDRCVCENRKVEQLEEEKRKLRQEIKQLRHTLRQHSRVMQVCDEVECLEKTLLKRRAELRQADRLLLEAHSRHKASWAQQQEAAQHIRALQEEVKELRRRRQEEQNLRGVKEVLRSREQELQQLGVKLL